MRSNKLAISIDWLGTWVDGAFHRNPKKDCNRLCREAGKLAEVIWGLSNKIENSGRK